MTNANAIEIRGLVKKYRRFQLGPLDLTVPRGAIYGLIGPNGAGKTTAIDLIFGMGRNDVGQIRVLGFDHRADEVSLKRRAAYVGPDLNFQVWGRVGKAIRFVRGFYPEWDDAYCAKLMKTFHLADADHVIALSFGARTKLSLLLALARRPEVLILDEPMTGLDPISKQQVFGELLNAIQDGERTVLISSHGLTDIERFADHIGMLRAGQLVLEGRTDEILDRYCFAEYVTRNGATTFPSAEGLTILNEDQNRWRALLDQKRVGPEWLEAHGAGQVSLTRLTLEELFIALFKEREAQ
jgi:ABC-2 type transport system ATP-binding protein